MQHSVSDGYRLLKLELSNLSPSSLKLLSSGSQAPSDTRLSLVLGFIPESAHMPAKKVIEDSWEMVEPVTPPPATPTSPNPSNWSPPRWAIAHNPSSPSKPTPSTQSGSSSEETVGKNWSPPRWAIPLRPTVKRAPSTPFGWQAPTWARSAHKQTGVLPNPFLLVNTTKLNAALKEQNLERSEADGEFMWVPPRWAFKSEF